jgi:hypothetical protein
MFTFKMKRETLFKIIALLIIILILIYDFHLQNQFELDKKINSERLTAPISSENVVKTDGNNLFDRIEEEIETNFSFINLTKIKILNVIAESQMVIGVCPNRQIDNIYLAKRRSNSVSIFDSLTNRIGEILTIPIENEFLMNPNKNVEPNTFILDLSCNGKNLFISVAQSYKSSAYCDHINLYKYDLKTKELELIFQSTPCISWLTPVWSDVSGRITSSEDKVWIAGGPIFTNMYENTYPNSGMPDLQNTSYNEFENSTNLFGAISEISLKNLTSQKIAKGFRAPQGLFYDTKTKTLWESEHGPRGGDELNLIEVGKDYGWPFVSYGRAYNSETMLPSHPGNLGTKYGTHENFEKPRYVWTPSIGASQLVVLNDQSKFNKYWENDIILSTLKSKSIVRIKTENKRIIYAENIILGHRIRDIELFENQLLASTDDGWLLFIKPLENKIPELLFPTP